ncbi:MAG: signal peptidase II [Candidatus Brocadiaceae bacterium]|nr:signal peptidase II [Candidatus Brocadiaceae bacterium]
MSRSCTALKGRRLFWILAAVTFLLDQLTKAWLWHHPDEGLADLDLIPQVLRIVSHPGNLHGVLGLGPGTPVFYVGASLAALGVIGFLLFTTDRGRTHLMAALGLVAGGAVGNLVDRVSHGFVRDFIDLHWRDRLHWHTFNVADAAICVGVAVILLDALLAPAQGQEAAPEDGETSP